MEISQLGEEEIVKRLTKREKYSLLEIIRKFKREGIENFIITRPELVNGLLDLYKKEKEKNAELKVLIERNLMYSHNLEKDLFENCSNYVISKDKIKAKIEEYNKQRQKAETQKINDMFVNYIDILQELLEEEE